MHQMFTFTWSYTDALHLHTLNAYIYLYGLPTLAYIHIHVVCFVRQRYFEVVNPCANQSSGHLNAFVSYFRFLYVVTKSFHVILSASRSPNTCSKVSISVVCLCVCVFVCLCLCLSVCLSIWLSWYQSLSMSVQCLQSLSMFVCLSLCLPLFLSLLSDCPFLWLCLRISLCLSVCLSLIL